ncbi:DUF1345 domain-containing protein [Streptomyces sp. SID14515]|uniref:DUF1345 domain-containing protein n=1 Tax=Streptomyces sp. SID14515 TaxID=2706074 RepID=UPI0013C5E2CA|nr:DUF1345 domain-containing protein [Streptomyces sp. SID14515]NEB41076.1 DUF1345 domain-containing protein [Streptomyces sp. SID14515]
MFSLVWGTFATTLGWVVATDFRGAAHRFSAFSHAAAPFGGSGATVMGVGFFRLVAGMFALTGPIVLVTGLLDLWRGEAEAFRLPPVDGWFVVMEAVILGAALWSYWRRSGFLRRQWEAGNGPRRAAVAGVTASIVAFAALLALGRGTWMMAAWLLGGLCGIALLLSDPAGTPSDSSAASPSPAPPAGQ